MITAATTIVSQQSAAQGVQASSIMTQVGPVKEADTYSTALTACAFTFQCLRHLPMGR